MANDRSFSGHDDAGKVSAMRFGANWFFWVAILAAASSLLVYFFNFYDHFVGLGVSHYFEVNAAAGADSQRMTALLIALAAAAALALFGYFARQGNDVAFILGMFLYFVDGVVLLGYREFFAFAFHLFAIFFMFKGLLASRRRYDPSVDATGA